MVNVLYKPMVHVTHRTMVDIGNFEMWLRDSGWIETLRAKPDSPIARLYATIAIGKDTLDHVVEFDGRQCYRSWGAGRETHDYIINVLEERHGNVFEHAWFSIAIAGVSRSLSHELVRHHTGFSVSQESQRFVNMSEANFVIPPAAIGDDDLEHNFILDMAYSLRAYQRWQNRLKQMEAGGKKNVNQAARCVLPNATETRLVGSFNLREFRNVIEQRGSIQADPEIRRLAHAMLEAVRPYAPCSLADVQADWGGIGYRDLPGGPPISVTYSKV